MSDRLADLGWPAARLGEALAALGPRSGFGVRPVETEAPPGGLAVEGSERLGPWLEATAARLGLEAEPVEAPYAEVGPLLRGAGPALVRLPGSPPRFLALLAGGRGRAAVLTPGQAVERIDPESVRVALCREVEAPVAGTVERLLNDGEVRGRRRRRARQALLDNLLAERRVGGCWVLRPAGAAGFAVQAGVARLPRLLAWLLGAHVCSYGLWVLSWWLLGGMALQGRLERGWLLAWLLLLLTLLPFRLLATAAGASLSIRAGALLKRRLLDGALRLETDDVRHLGVGQLLGCVIESEAVESLALTGGFLGLTAAVELVVAGLVLGAGAGGWPHALVLAGTVLATLLLVRRYYRRRREWTAQRLALTNDLVERMVGHRTRLAQEAGDSWHDAEDQALERYLRGSGRLDRTAAALQVLVPRGWFLAGFLGLAPAFVAGGRSAAALAVGVGGIVLAYRALRNLVEGLEGLVAAAVAWERVRPFWRAASRPEPVGDPAFAAGAPAPTAAPSDGTALLDARDVVFRYRERGEPVLHGVAVRIRPGDRLLLEGPSGGGKSTLAALLAGSRTPSSGLLLLAGLDRETLGAGGWRRRVALAPQFHENHVLIGTFAFNALMGREWPPRPGDLEEAERVCRSLDLGPLLDRMPAGMQQMVGETGWQLSHGEKSRLYLARALLQGAELIVLDESFAALDPQTLRHALAYVLDKAPTVLVIAHP
jgi:ATP-binding cassette subfamily B protein